jgi:hypothetical protein
LPEARKRVFARHDATTKPAKRASRRTSQVK